MSELEDRIREAVQIERERCSFLARYGEIEDLGIEMQRLVELRHEIATLIEGGPKPVAVES